MARPPMNNKKKGTSPDKKMKKKTSILTTEKITWVDYKDVNLLRRFMSERAKIRARRVTGNDQQQQAAVAKAIKLSREMALLPYSVRQVQQRSKGKGRGERRGEQELSAEDAGLVERYTDVAESQDGADVEVIESDAEFVNPEAIDGGDDE